MHNLGRFVSIQKPKPTNWRKEHAFCLADRFDVIETPKEEEKNVVSFYSYVRGNFLDKSHLVHLNGLGDF